MVFFDEKQTTNKKKNGAENLVFVSPFKLKVGMVNVCDNLTHQITVIIHLNAHILKRQKNIVNNVRPSGIPNVIVISIISILVLNVGLAPMQEQLQQQQAYATTADIPKTSDLKRDIKQGIDEQNTCHRSDDCKQANDGQQLQGKDNEANGFNDQSKNIEQQHQQQQSTTPTA